MMRRLFGTAAASMGKKNAVSHVGNSWFLTGLLLRGYTICNRFYWQQKKVAVSYFDENVVPVVPQRRCCNRRVLTGR